MITQHTQLHSSHTWNTLLFTECIFLILKSFAVLLFSQFLSFPSLAFFSISVFLFYFFRFLVAMVTITTTQTTHSYFEIGLSIEKRERMCVCAPFIHRLCNLPFPKCVCICCCYFLFFLFLALPISPLIFNRPGPNCTGFSYE